MGLAEKLFGPKKTVEDQAKEWKRKLKKEARGCDRQVRQIEREEMKIKRSIKQAAKQGDMVTVRQLAKELVHSKKSKDRLHVAKANLNSLTLQIMQQAAQMKVVGAMKKSADIMRIMNDVLKVPEMAKVMREMSKQMEKAGMIEEMTNDIMEDVFEQDSDEEDEVIDTVLADVLGDQLKKFNVGKSKLPEKEANEEEDDELSKRLQSLKSA